MGSGLLVCGACAASLREGARFCDSCGSPVTESYPAAEYKQVTVLFADVVRSMDLAATLHPERLRDIMSAVFNRSATVVQRYGGTVDKFTGDGIMALFGAPVALEDHAFRACLAALDIQHEMTRLAADAQAHDGIELRLRIGLNSGEVIAGGIDTSSGGYTAIGIQVGMAQRMESVAPPGGVMLSESTSQLVSHAVMLGEPGQVTIKGSDVPVTAYRLLGTGDPGRHRRHDTTLVGRTWELSAMSSILDQAIGGAGALVGIVGPPGIGKSRIVSELTDVAAHRGLEVFSTYCEAHARDIPFHAVARLLRAVFGVNAADPETARGRLRVRLAGANADDLVLLDDLLGITDAATPPLDIDADARRRRLTALINTASLGRTTPTLYVVEDAHWIDDVSDSMLADFMSVIPHTPSMVITTYRLEYAGALARLPRSQTISLAPLDDSQTAALSAELLGEDPSVEGLAARIAGHAAGNPFFVEEIVRDLAERGIIGGRRGEYSALGSIMDLAVPSTLQAVITARVDRLTPAAKRTLNAAAAVGSRFSADLVARLVDTTDLATLVAADLIDQVMYTPHAEYAFRHPMIRTVAYESQLKSSRADLHRRLATSIEIGEPDAVEENAALIAEHLQAAGDLDAAYGWHMRAAVWSQYRDIGAAKTSWERARDAADAFPDDQPNKTAQRIAPRMMLCVNSWRIGGEVRDAGFDELRELTDAAGDKVSLAIAMAGWLAAVNFNGRTAEAAQLATECASLIEAIDQPVLTVGLLAGPLQAKFQAVEAAETLRLADLVVELADGDPTMGNLAVACPLSIGLMYQGSARIALGRPGFGPFLDSALATARPIDSTCFATVAMLKYTAILNGAVLADATALADTAEALAAAEHSGDNFGLGSALLARGVALLESSSADAVDGCELLERARSLAAVHRFTYIADVVADVALARWHRRIGDPDGAADLARSAIAKSTAAGDRLWPAAAASALVDTLLDRPTTQALGDVQAVIDDLAAMPVDDGVVLSEIHLLRMRALLERAHGNAGVARELATRYRDCAAQFGHAGHLASAAVLLDD